VLVVLSIRLAPGYPYYFPMDDPSNRNAGINQSMINRIYRDYIKSNRFYPGSPFVVFPNRRMDDPSNRKRGDYSTVRGCTSLTYILLRTIESNRFYPGSLFWVFPIGRMDDPSKRNAICRLYYICQLLHKHHVHFCAKRTHSYTQQSTNSSSSSSSSFPRACFNLCFFLSTVSPKNS
jgi:hypothetical protein